MMFSSYSINALLEIAGLVLEFEMLRHFDTNWKDFTFFFYPMLSSKTFAIIETKINFCLGCIWFDHDCVCSNIEHLSNIDEMIFKVE